MESSSDTFTLFFQAATGRGCKLAPGSHEPYPYQTRLTLGPIASRLIHIPTGAGKTAAIVAAWLYRRQIDPENIPRRLVYCLPVWKQGINLTITFDRKAFMRGQG